MDYYHQLKKQQLNFDVLIPFMHFQQELARELLLKNVQIFIQTERLFLVAPCTQNIIWAQDHWSQCHSSEVNPELVAQLKSVPVMGYYFKTETNKLVEKSLSKLKRLPEKRIRFDYHKKFNFKFYIWTTYKDLVIYSLHPQKNYPAGWHEFEEDKNTPPNRAYLKLWEILMTQNLNISNHSRAIEIGAAPGGWSWVLSQLFDQVYTFDRADLAENILKIKNIKHEKADAFKIDPAKYNDCDWFFSDLICTPDKILETVLCWQAHGRVQNFVCTLKFKGDCDFEIIDKFLKIPDSKIIRLYHNKNEVTWIKQGSK